MALTPYCDDLADAMRHLEWTTSATTYPTTTGATELWNQAHRRLYSRLVARGLTVSAAGDDRERAADIESLFASCLIGSRNDMQDRGDVDPSTNDLCARGEKELQEILDQPELLESLGATFNAEKYPYPSSLAVDHPNPNYDSSEVLEVLPTWTEDMDL